MSKTDAAVAIRYDPDSGRLPHVTAKGRGAIAARIRAVARESGVAVREDPELLSLLEKLEVGDDIPPVAYAAMAEVIAYIYRLEKARRASPHG